jgi:PAS domain S-box-containing protein
MDESTGMLDDQLSDALSRGDVEAGLAAVVDAIITVDDHGSVQDIIDVGTPTLGYTGQELSGAQVETLFAADSPVLGGFDVSSVAEFRTALLEPSDSDVLAPVRAADGTVVPMALSVAPRESAAGTVCLARTVSTATGEYPESVLLDSIPDPVYVLDAQGCFETVNEAMVLYTGYERGDLVGRHITELLPGETSNPLQRGADGTFGEARSHSERIDMTIVTKDGERVLTEAHVVTQSVGDDSGLRSVGVLRDIGQHRRREENLELLKQVLSRVFRHNVRNELTIIQSRAQLLEQKVDDHLKSHTEKILAPAERLLGHSEKARLIQEIVETERLTEIDIARVVSDVVETARKRYPDATIHLDAAEGLSVEAHPHIERAVEELVQNAVEHAPASDRATVDVWFDDRDGTAVYVEDESGGLSEQEIAVLRRGRESDLEHGSGVGLWLVRWLAEYSEAEMVVHRTDSGSLMGIRFPGSASEEDIQRDARRSPLARAPAHLQEPSPESFHGDAVIERVEPQQRLDDTFEALHHTGGQTVLIRGAAGMGKTTLVEQFTDRLQDRAEQPVVATGVCAADLQSPYHAFRQILEALPGERDISQGLDDVVSLSSDDPDELEQRKRTLFAEIAAELRTVAGDDPVVVVLEDLQWADSGTVDLFEYLVEEVGRWGHPIMFVGTYRTGAVERSHDVVEITEETADAGRGTVIRMEPFDTEDVASLLSHLLGVDTVPSSFVEAVYDHTGGTPLFVNELGLRLAETVGAVETGSELPADLQDIAVPETVESAIADRLDALPGTCREVLEVGAVVGRELSFDVLREATDEPTDSLVRAIDALVRRRLWTRSEDSLEFVHGIVRTQALDAIGDDDGRLHERVAAAIETVHSDTLDEHAGRLAEHYEQAGAIETAFDYYRQAGDYARETYAIEEAIEFYEQAVALADEHDCAGPDPYADVLKELCNCYQQTGRFDQASEIISDGLSRIPADSIAECKLLGAQTGTLLNAGSYEEAETVANRELAKARTLDSRQYEVQALKQLGLIRLNTGELDDARDYFVETLELVRERDEPQAEAKMLHDLGRVADKQSNFLEAREYYTSALERNRELGYKRGEADAFTGLGLVHRKQGNDEQAREHIAESLDLYREIGDRPGVAHALNNLGLIANGNSDYDAAEEHYRESYEIAMEMGMRQTAAIAADNLGTVFVTRGDYEQASEHYREALRIYGEIGDSLGKAISNDNLGGLAIERGEFDRARCHLEESLEIIREVGNQYYEVTARYDLGRLALRQRAHEEARKHFEAAHELATTIEIEDKATTALCGRAAVARREGRYEQARSYLDDATADADGGGENADPPVELTLERIRLGIATGEIASAREHARTLRRTLESRTEPFRLATVQQLQGRIAWQSGSVSEARQLLQDALDTFQQLGVPHEALRTLRYLVEIARDTGDEQTERKWLKQAEILVETAPEPVAVQHEAQLSDHREM